MEQSVIVSTGVQELCRLFKDDENLWNKSPVHGRDVLVQHNYECAFGVSNNMRTRNHNSWIEASRSFAYVKEDHVNLAISLIEVGTCGVVRVWSLGFTYQVTNPISCKYIHN